ncbi:peptidase M50B-like-domain-containing protein [Papiliotrema laurentii]|uniref:Peptidase M50B-like-domain-containing protein n=1 Tax=Papiliotrema laurentii TaxID=5418 RepID=A0AAD9FW63_PAPLA|nr:peptidase M50B-like-domain-containing protein [Papiliotrema laurentii]
MSPVPEHFETEQRLYARAVADTLRPNDTQKTTLIVAGCYVVAIGLLVGAKPAGLVRVDKQWHIPVLENIIYPFKLLTVGMHELQVEQCPHRMPKLTQCQVLTCARVEQIQLDPHEGGSTRMRGGIPAITLPAGYLGSSFIGACLIACGFDTNASKVAVLVLAVLWILTLWWARRSWVAWVTIALVAGLILICWLVKESVALRFFVLFIGVMSCLYSDTLARKVNSSDASEYATMIGCCGSRFWGGFKGIRVGLNSPGAFWLLQSVMFFAAGILVGLAVFKDDWSTQRAKASDFLGGTP